MLIRFQVENYRSFDKQANLSLIPGLVRSHEDHIIRGEGKNSIDILKAIILYGANASGKSNLVQAIDFARKLIVHGTRANQSISTSPFKLAPERKQDPSRFEFEFKTNIRCYKYGFRVTSDIVVDEWLYEVRKTKEIPLFERRTKEGKTEVINMGLRGKRKEKNFIDFVGMGTRPNQLFLTECIDRDVKLYNDVYDWFRKTLEVIYPHSHYIAPGLTSFKTNKSSLKSDDLLVYYLQKFDTGVCGYGYLSINPETEFPQSVLDEIREQIKQEEHVIVVSPDGDRYNIQLDPEDPSKLNAQALGLKHLDSEGQEEIFGFEDESDGTIRLLDLIPMLAEDTDGPSKVFIIDELDRSIHTIISYEIVKEFLSSRSNNQLVATTHEPHLLDLDLLRRDEIWFAEKDFCGSSTIYSLEEYAPRHDTDIEKGYLLGRFGAIPVCNSVGLDLQGEIRL